VATIDRQNPSADLTKPKQIRWFRRIGAPGFEPGTSCSQSKRATRLRHAPLAVEYTGASIGLVGVAARDEQMLRELYAAFNARDVDAVLAALAPDVDWPNVLEGTRAVGRDAVRTYWTGQFAQMDPRVEPLAFSEMPDGRIAVDVHQIVRDLDGAVQADNLVIHTYTLGPDGLVARMDAEHAPGDPRGPGGDAHPVHRYSARTSWQGSTAQGYDAYDRAHGASAPPAHTQLALSSDPAFNGDPARLNPEQLVVLAASSCQLLSFLAVAARARIDVVAYEDEAEAVMPEADRPVRITQITLRPRITVKGDAPADERLRKLVETAHRQCYVSNSLSTEIAVEPTFVRASVRSRP
jgi:organic hydroperoxide reductase OsmC/OhrA